MIILKCTICNKEFLEKPYRAKVAKFCSQKCYGFSIRGRIPKSAFKKSQHTSIRTEFKSGKRHPYFGKSSPALGKHWKLSAETRKRMSKAQQGNPHPKALGHKPYFVTPNELNPNWKGDGVGYSGLHSWIRRKLGKPKTCKHCGKIFPPNSRKLHWASKSGKYLREFNDWLRLCVACHQAYDNLPQK